MPGRNQPRSSRGRSAIARVAINTGNTNGFMYQGTCIAEDGTKITPCRNFGGMKKGGARPSATGFMRARPWQISVPAKRKNFIFRMNTSQVTTEQAKSTAVCTLDSHCPEYHHCHPKHELADKITGCMKDDDMHVDDSLPLSLCTGKALEYIGGTGNDPCGMYGPASVTCNPCNKCYIYYKDGEARSETGYYCKGLSSDGTGCMVGQANASVTIVLQTGTKMGIVGVENK